MGVFEFESENKAPIQTAALRVSLLQSRQEQTGVAHASHAGFLPFHAKIYAN